MTTDATISIATDDGPMPAYESRPGGDGAVRGGVVVVQEALGVTPHIEGVVRWLAAEGWHAVAPALFHRQGSPVLDYGDLEKVMPIMQTLNAGGITTDVISTLDYLDRQGHPSSKVGVVGFCMGGNVTFYAATVRPLGAAVSFYGGGISQGRFGLPSLIELARSLATPWLGLFGDQDKGIPVEEVEQLRAAAAAAPVDTEIVRYADATHGFNCDDRPQAFNPEAAADGRRRTLDWFATHIG